MIYRFDDFTLDSGTRTLLNDEQEVHLSPKAFDLLMMLIENRSRAVSKVDLQQRLWPSTYVLETNLAGLVAARARGSGREASLCAYRAALRILVRRHP